MTGNAYMPLYVGDYLGDTSHLSTIEHGAYMLLLMHYWRHGGLPADDCRLAQIARMTDQEWRSAKVVIARFFSRKWKHKRVEAELMRSQNRSKNAKNAAHKRHSKNKDFHANALLRARVPYHKRDNLVSFAPVIPDLEAYKTDPIEPSPALLKSLGKNP